MKLFPPMSAPRLPRRPLTLSILTLVLAATFTPITQASVISERFDRVCPSVVVIRTTSRSVDPTGRPGLVSSEGLGSGVLISDDGKIFTASHVVQAADDIKVTFHDGPTIRARVLSSQPEVDLAVLQLEALPGADWPHAELGDSDAVDVGDEVFVVGAPLGLTHTLTVGHISARRGGQGLMGALYGAELLQTDAAINQGNSGGPMFDLEGRVVGIVSHIVTRTGGFDGLGFAVASNLARQALLEDPPMWSGMSGRLLPKEIASLLNVPAEAALLVEQVAIPSPANHMGIRGGSIPANIGGVEFVLGGDVLLEVFGVPMSDPDVRRKIAEEVRRFKDGDPMQVKVWRGGREVELNNFYFPDLLVPQPPPVPVADQ